ncbi:hypothetical protein PVL29_001697 [Vitis rotundifolia]|uniref:Uncharacterized protein n=1 Tax=Vitis rotundifolia TaxID=103349 RepID=A0AA39AFW3_VITRO|nr:hypothetical protein PVL29_001697 [Vitis rotundifolia]
MGRAPCCSEVGLRRGPWTADYIRAHGQGNWRFLCGKSYGQRWMNYLRPDVKRGKHPGRTDNEIKNYWRNYHLSKRLKHKGKNTKEPSIINNKNSKIYRAKPEQKPRPGLPWPQAGRAGDAGGVLVDNGEHDIGSEPSSQYEPIPTKNIRSLKSFIRSIYSF